MMTPLEQLVWAAAYANEFASDLRWNRDNNKSIDDINGYSCAEVADVAVEKLREAVTPENSEFLLVSHTELSLPIKDGP